MFDQTPFSGDGPPEPPSGGGAFLPIFAALALLMILYGLASKRSERWEGSYNVGIVLTLRRGLARSTAMHVEEQE